MNCQVIAVKTQQGLVLKSAHSLLIKSFGGYSAMQTILVLNNIFMCYTEIFLLTQKCSHIHFALDLKSANFFW